MSKLKSVFVVLISTLLVLSYCIVPTVSFAEEETAEDKDSKIVDVHMEVSDSTPEVGDVITYSVDVEKLTDEAVSNVSFVDELPDGLDYVEKSFKTNNGYELTESDNGITVKMDDLVEKSAFTFDAKVVDTANMMNSMEFAAEGEAYNTLAGEETADATPVITMTAQADKESYNKDEVVNFTIRVNNSEAQAQNVNMVMTLPEGIEWDADSVGSFVYSATSQSSDKPFSYNGSDLNLQVDSMDVGGWFEVSVAGKVVNDSVDVLPVTVNLQATDVASPVTSTINVNVKKATVEPTTEQPTEETTTETVEKATLSISKTVDKEKVKTGDVVTYTIKVKSKEGVAKNAVVTDVLPKGLEYVKDSLKSETEGIILSFDNNTIRGTIAELGSDEVTITFKAKVTQEYVKSTTTNVDGDMNVSDSKEYVVGKDIDAGYYKMYAAKTGSDGWGGYWCVFFSKDGSVPKERTLSSTLTNGIVMNDEVQLIRVENNMVLQISNNGGSDLRYEKTNATVADLTYGMQSFYQNHWDENTNSYVENANVSTTTESTTGSSSTTESSTSTSSATDANTITNTASVKADNADEVSDFVTITIIGGSSEISDNTNGRNTFQTGDVLTYALGGLLVLCLGSALGLFYARKRK